MKRTRDIRVIRTQTALLEALEDLIKTKKLSNITITELCTAAKINRNTFYYHYNNIFEFLDEHKNLIIDDLNEIAEISKTHNKQNLVEVFTVLKKHPHFLNILISPNCDLDFFNEIFEVASSKASIIFSKDPNTLTNRERLLCAYCNAGCNAVIMTWIMNDMKESPEEIADFIWTSSKSGIFSLLFPNEEFD
ncbi:MAG: TetR/AcrR family transcriptional regulator [Clostridiales bacterium]|nr:TetR/AcrR family transcriptional regulator [Clostridiales bacterium]MBR6959052.1 TetR/AcrR family transcriptional regulator [Clostridiales bacterium]